MNRFSLLQPESLEEAFAQLVAHEESRVEYFKRLLRNRGLARGLDRG